VIYLCSCGFGTDDREWLQGHLSEHPGHHERPASRLLIAAPAVLANVAQRPGGHCDMETRGCRNLPAAMRSWRQRPGGALTNSQAPSAETLCDAPVANGRRLPAIMRPSAAPAGR